MSSKGSFPSDNWYSTRARWTQLHDLLKEGYDTVCSDDVIENEIKSLLAFLANLPIKHRALEFAINDFFLSFDFTLESYRVRLEGLKVIEKLEENTFFNREELSQ